MSLWWTDVRIYFDTCSIHLSCDRHTEGFISTPVRSRVFVKQIDRHMYFEDSMIESFGWCSDRQIYFDTCSIKTFGRQTDSVLRTTNWLMSLDASSVRVPCDGQTDRCISTPVEPIIYATARPTYLFRCIPINLSCDRQTDGYISTLVRSIFSYEGPIDGFNSAPVRSRVRVTYRTTDLTRRQFDPDVFVTDWLTIYFDC